MSEAEVLTAAAKLVAHFGAFDRDAYFACFGDDATFTFYNYEHRLGSRPAYEALWDEWASDGWRVTSCQSSGGRVQMITNDVAVFTHDVATTFAGDSTAILERESIVFVRRNAWLAVHEHLSPQP